MCTTSVIRNLIGRQADIYIYNFLLREIIDRWSPEREKREREEDKLIIICIASSAAKMFEFVLIDKLVDWIEHSECRRCIFSVVPRGKQ